MDSPEYIQNTISKLHLYSENKIIPDHNLIITIETQSEPLTPHIIEQEIEAFLKLDDYCRFNVMPVASKGL